MVKLCPICKEKYLVGRHKRTCMRKYPVGWLNFYLTLQDIDRRRFGRCELAERLERP